MEESKPSILVVGSANMDLTLATDALPLGGESIYGSAYHYNPGGKGANQASAAALLGAETWFAGKVGQDENGRSLRRSLEGFGVNTRWLLEDAQAPTGLAAIILEKTGQNRILVYPGANLRLAGGDVAAPIEALRPDAIVLQLEIPDETAIACCAAANAMGIPVVVDAGPAKPFPIEKLEKPLVFSPNETETKVFCGLMPDTEENAKRAALMLWERTRATYVVIKRGEQGAFLRDAEGQCANFPAVPVKCVDSTAAGDAFTAALAVHFMRTRDIAAAIRYANAVGALSVTKAGAQSSMPTAAEVEEFIANKDIG